MAWPREKNFQGREIPTSMGVLFIAAILIFLPLLANLSPEGFKSLTDFTYLNNRLWASLYGLSFLMCLLGLLDDLLRGPQARGFKGHLELLFRGRVSTGLLKAVGGGLASLAVAWWVPVKPSITQIIINGLIIALTVNVFNLLDLRPGRAMKVYLISLIAVGVAAYYQGSPIIFPYTLPIAAAVLGLFSLDLRSGIMLGDAGSNVLGASIGLGLMVVTVSLPVKIAALVLLISLNLISEKWSFTKIIEATPPLKWFDELGRPD